MVSSLLGPHIVQSTLWLTDGARNSGVGCVCLVSGRFIAGALSGSGKSPRMDIVGLHALHILQSV